VKDEMFEGEKVEDSQKGGGGVGSSEDDSNEDDNKSEADNDEVDWPDLDCFVYSCLSDEESEEINSDALSRSEWL
jgi:hypothetical protein